MRPKDRRFSLGRTSLQTVRDIVGRVAMPDELDALEPFIGEVAVTAGFAPTTSRCSTCAHHL